MILPRNPFFHRHRITHPSYFHGRQQELEHLYGALLTGQCRAVVGERKMGKSSLLSCLAAPSVQRRFGVDQERNLFAYLDLEGMASASRSEFWQEVLGQFASGPLEEELRLLFRSAAQEGEIRFMRVRRLLRQAGDAGYRLVLILDEFEALAQSPNFGPDFYGELRSLAGEVGVVYITASRRSLYELTYRHSDTLSSPFFNIFTELPLGLMPEAEVQTLLEEISRLGGQPGLGPEEVRLALEWAGPHPFFAQVAGYHLWELGAGERTLLPAEREQARRRFLAEAEDHYRYWWAQLDETERTGVLHPERVSEEVRRRLLRRGVLRAVEGELRPFSQPFAEFAQRQEQATSTTPSLTAALGEDLTGQSIGPYRVLERCGQGGMAEVYKGYHPLIDRYVAIKVLRPALASDEEFRRRFQREATAVAALRHPNIVQLYDFGQIGERFYMVMEYIEGGTLRDRLQARPEGQRRLPPAEVAAIVRGIAAALDYAHQRGIVHRDVKPANVMFTRDGDPVLTDFGIARMLGEGSVTMAGVSVGTPDYMSPEQARGEPATPASDVYALGVMVYEMLTGRRPFDAETPLGVIVQHLQAAFPSPRQVDPSFPEALENVLHRALAKEPAARYPTAGELARELESAVEAMKL
ncbi:MAG: protein kinase domain-containing protein [Chloroflexia bacterium]